MAHIIWRPSPDPANSQTIITADGRRHVLSDGAAKAYEIPPGRGPAWWRYRPRRRRIPPHVAVRLVMSDRVPTRQDGGENDRPRPWLSVEVDRQPVVFFPQSISRLGGRHQRRRGGPARRGDQA